MSNYSTYQDAIKTAESSAGTTAAKYEAYMDSIEAHMNKLMTSWETFTQRLGQSPVIKGIVDFATFLVDHLDKIITRVLSFITVLNAYKIPSFFSKMWTGTKNLFTGNKGEGGTKFGVVRNGFTMVGQKLDEVKNAIKNPNAADSGTSGGGNLPKSKKSAKARWGAAALTGAVAGLSAGLSGTNSYFGGLMGSSDVKINDIQSDFVDNLTNGVATGAATGLLSAIPGVGPILGPVLGPIIGDGIGGLFKWLRHRDEIERKQRVQDALKVVDAINKANESVKKIDEQISKRGSADFDAVAVRDSIYSTLNSLYAAPNGKDVIRDFEERMSAEAKDLGIAEGRDANYYLELLVNGTDEQAEAVNRILNATLDINKAFQTYASQEQTRYDNAKKVEEVRNTARKFGLDNTGTVEDLLKTLSDKYNQDYANLSESEQEELNKAILTLQQVQTSYAEMAQEVNKSAFSFGVGNSGVGGWSAADIYNKSLEEAILNTIEEVEKSGAAVGITLRDYNGDITKEARDFAVSTLKGYGNLGTLFKRETTALYKLLGDKNKRDTLGGVLGGFTEAIKRIQRNDGWLADYEEAVGKNLFTGTAEQYRSYMLQLDASSTELESFAKALGVSEDDLKDHTELFDISLKELSRSVSETAESMKKMTGYIDSIISMGGLSVMQLQEILKENPLLIKRANGDGTYSLDTSIENIFNNIWAKTMGKQAETLYNQAIINDRLSNQTFIDSFREALENAGEDASYLAGVSNLSTALDKIRGSGKNTNHIELLNELLSASFTEDIETQKSVLSQLTSYQTKLIDIQIDNLNSQKDAISKVNDEYKKQIDLVKAQQALENAKNEKKKVYRAGVGWTYEADQEAIRKAQEDLNEKENNIKEENLQYQIDLLQKSKEILEGLPTEMSFQQSKKFFETFENSLSSAGTSVSDFVVAINDAYIDLSKIDFDAIYKKIAELTGTNTGVVEAIAEGRESLAARKGETANIASSSGWYRSNGTKITGLRYYKQNADKAGMSLEDYMTSQGYKYFEKGAPKIFGTEQSADWKTEAGKYNDFLSYLTSKGGLFERLDVGNWINEDGTIKTAAEINKMYGLTGESALDDETVKEWTKLYNTYFGKEAIDIKPYGVTETLGNSQKIDLGSGYYLYTNLKKSLPDAKFAYNTADFSIPSTIEKAYKQALSDYKLSDSDVFVMKDGVIYTNPQKGWEKITPYTSYGMGSGSRSYSVYPYFDPTTNQLDEGLKAGSIKAALMNKGYQASGRGGVVWSLKPGIKYVGYPSFYKGTFDSLNTGAIINEFGTEGIVTPQGTITALPSHTGIVPADLTRNLYQLGELSPNLIKGLSTLKTEANRFNSTEDNSMHVNDLNITVNADSGYDFNRLLSEARQYMAITRHNK